MNVHNEDVRKLVGNSLRNVPSRIRQSQKNPQATNEERCQGEIELDSLEKVNEGIGNNSVTE